jgi:uncharacterized protein
VSGLSAEWREVLGAAYLPGSGVEPPRAALAEVRAALPRRVDADWLADAASFRLALELYGAGYFWEAHEVIEPLLDATLPNSAERNLLEAIIQLSNACLKLRMQQPNAAVRLIAESLRFLGAARGLQVGVDIDALVSQCAALRLAIQAHDPAIALTMRPVFP